MNAYDIGTFLDQEVYDEDCCIYLVRNKDKCLYIGKTSRNIYDRWLSPWGHITFGVNGEFIGLTSIGKEVINNLPVSRSWTIELYNLEDCKKLQRKHGIKVNKLVDISILTAFTESMMIKKYSPLLNAKT